MARAAPYPPANRRKSYPTEILYGIEQQVTKSGNMIWHTCIAQILVRIILECLGERHSKPVNRITINQARAMA